MRELKKYFREIKAMLPCAGGERKKILSDLQLAVENFMQENPNATFANVVSHFGKPEEIAGSYAEEIPPQELRRKLMIRRSVIGIVAGAVVCGLLAWLTIVGIAIVNYFKGEDGVLEVEAPVVEEEIIIEEDVIVEEVVGDNSEG